MIKNNDLPRIFWRNSKNWIILILLIIIVILVYLLLYRFSSETKSIFFISQVAEPENNFTQSADNIHSASNLSWAGRPMALPKKVYSEDDDYKNATTKQGMRRYLAKYPNGEHATMVSQLLIAVLDKEQQHLNALHKKLQEFAPGLVMVEIPKGQFQMGDLSGEGHSDERPAHEVTISSFWLSKNEITFAQYDLFAKNKDKPDDSGWGRGNRPVINVTWNNAQAYAKWLSEKTGEKFRLPSEAEWEYAARAGSTTKYSWGNSISCGDADYYYEECNAWGTSPVGLYKPNGFGLYDMSGNAWEWVTDCFHFTYDKAPVDGTAWVAGSCDSHVLRGGSWNNVPDRLTLSYRASNSSDYHYSNTGFRLARED